MKELLKQLSELSAPTGGEEEVAEYLAREFRKSGFDVRRDTLGNVIAKKGKGKKVMVVAHMDEICMAVMGITKEGFIKFTKIGGIYDGILGSSRVVLHAKGRKITGIIGMKPPHLMKEEESKKMQESDAMYVDVGAKDKKAVEEMGIRPGTLISFASKFEELNHDKVVGKAFDNRAGCAILVELAHEIKNPGCELYLVGSVREETGLWGAGVSAFGIQPDLAIATDVSFASGSPDVSEDTVPVHFNGGPSLGVIEAGGRGLMMTKKLIEWIEHLAKRKKIKMQFDVIDRGATDASRMQYLREGLLTASICVPSRYIHSQNEMISLSDLEETKDLIREIILNFDDYE
ncbi:peptidase M42 [Candidatus Micrarchaeota archaeon CG08_land_8_20_14_0_20_59_11]|nr:MAG: peptidase M42 [Candidatus Micrarchaeota archaeon CG08_land_8_20_14_0_20_59_11]